MLRKFLALRFTAYVVLLMLFSYTVWPIAGDPWSWKNLVSLGMLITEGVLALYSVVSCYAVNGTVYVKGYYDGPLYSCLMVFLAVVLFFI